MEIFNTTSFPAGGLSPRTPSLIKIVTENQRYGFDVEQAISVDDKANGLRTYSESALETKAAAASIERLHSVSISMPLSPMKPQLQQSQDTTLLKDLNELLFYKNTSKSGSTSTSSSDSSEKQTISHSEPIPISKIGLSQSHPAIIKPKDDTYDSFKTWSGLLERQMSGLRGVRNRETPQETNSQQNKDVEPFNVDRYFDALQGPELDTLRPSEEIVLPEDKQWPFLLRYPVSSFGICLGVSSQAIMWKALALSPSTKFLHVSLHINLALWCISVALVALVSSIYILKMILYFEAVRREYFHPIRVNFFFAPWISLLFLVLGAPPSLCQNLHASLWYILMAPIFCLELKIYGQWMSGGQRRLSKVANASNHLSIVGNFVGALLGATMGLKEGPLFFFAVGLAHYIVLFVTLYQRLPTNQTLPKELHPVFFLFVAAPSVASTAWTTIQGSFDNVSRIGYFVALFLYFSLAVRINFFRGFTFSLAWWAYTFPMTAAAVATIKYSTAVTNIVTKCLVVSLCGIATLSVTALLVTTVFHAFVLRDLFPNDIAIAISDRKRKSTKKWHIIRAGSSGIKSIEQYLKFANPKVKDVESPATEPANSTAGTSRGSSQSDFRFSQL